MKAISRRYQDAVSRIPNLTVIISTLLFLIVLIVIFSNLSPAFLTQRNLFNILNQTSIFLILGVGMTLVMATGNLDISIGSMIALTTTILGITVIGYGFPWWLGLIICILAGGICGAFNGFVVSKFNVPSIVVTLGTLTIFKFIANWYIEGTVYAFFPEPILWITRTRFLGLNFNIFLSIIIFLIASYFLTKTTTGRYLIVTGANRNIANLSGIKTNIIRFFPFLLMGLLVGVVSIILSSRLNSAQAATGVGMEMHTIAAVVLGGTTIMGGKALMSGTLLGVFILSVLENGTTLAGLGYYWQRVIIGFLFITVVAIHSWREKRTKQ